jgi:hypothetical protein
MQELKFIKYLIRLSNKYDSITHKYFPDKDLRDLYNQNLCKKFNLIPNTIINVEINLLKNLDLVVKETSEKVKLIKSIKKKFVLCPSRIVLKNISHAVLIVYWKDENKFYICDSTGTHGNCQKTIDTLNQLYRIVFDSNYEIICYSIQDLENKNKHIGFVKGEYTRGYCLAWSYLLAYIIIKYNWVGLGINELIESIKWNVEYSPKTSRQLIRGFVIYNLT